MARPLEIVVVVPARDEEARIATCLEALAGQQDVDLRTVEVLVVLDDCSDRTAEVVSEVAARRRHPAVGLLDGPARGPGVARALGLEVARQRLAEAGADPERALLCTTDADTRAAPDWLARTVAAVSAGADAVAGRVDLDPVEARSLAPVVLDHRRRDAEERLATLRRRDPEAGHHQFSGASIALTAAAYDEVGGMPALPALEDEALQRALRKAGLRIVHDADVVVVTSARTESRLPRGVAPLLRSPDWSSVEVPPAGVAPSPDAYDVVVAPPGAERGTAIWRALVDREAREVLVVLPAPAPGLAGALAATLLGQPGLVLAKAAPPEAHPLDDLVARPLLGLHAPRLAHLHSPLAPAWAARRDALLEIALPQGDAVDLTVLLDLGRRHGADAIAQVPVPDLGGAPAPADPAATAYALHAAVERRRDGLTSPSTRFSGLRGEVTVPIGEHPPRRGPGRARLEVA